jgi:hypothetical protein
MTNEKLEALGQAVAGAVTGFTFTPYAHRSASLRSRPRPKTSNEGFDRSQIKAREGVELEL